MRIGACAPQLEATDAFGAAECYLGQAVDRLHVVRSALRAHGERSLSQYLTHVVRFAVDPVQSRDDLIDVVAGHTARLLGDDVARRTAADLTRLPVVLSANHHGVDFFAQSMQSNLAFALRTGEDGWRPSTVPIFACGTVPLNNVTYPRGLLLYRAGDAASASGPLKVPVFPDRMKRELVNVARGVDLEMVERARKRIHKLVASGQAHPTLAPAAEAVLREDYCDTTVLALDRYADQATRINQRIWKRLFRDPDVAPDLVYLELEHLAARLLDLDLADPTSLAWSVMFEPKVRTRLVAALDGARACWDVAAIAARTDASGHHEPAGHGTVFFWAIGEAGGRIPLAPVDGADGPVLRGVDDWGNVVELALTPESVLDALRAGRLMPSIFSSYLTIALARGVSCVGGYYQAEYLPAMQRAVAQALEANATTAGLAPRVRAIPTTAYLSGMQMVMNSPCEQSLAPSGPLEMIAAGGLAAEDLIAIGQLTVREAHLASVVDTVLDAVPREAREGDWERAVSQDLHRLLANRIVLN